MIIIIIIIKHHHPKLVNHLKKIINHLKKVHYHHHQMNNRLPLIDGNCVATRIQLDQIITPRRSVIVSYPPYNIFTIVTSIYTTTIITTIATNGVIIVIVV